MSLREMAAQGHTTKKGLPYSASAVSSVLS